MGGSFASRIAREPQRAVGGTAKRPRSIQTAQERLLELQRMIGNQAVIRLLGSAGQAPGRPSGQPLDPGTRQLMEARFGHDFGGVRIHWDPTAARQVDANAFTVGHDIVLGAGAPSLETADGQRLVAHELAHVVQQRRGGPPPGRGPESVSERDADTAASAVAGGHTVAAVSQGTAVGVARQSDDPRHQRGYAGEQGMGFTLYPASEGWIFFEGPSGSAGHGTTESGFDGAAYNIRTGELQLVDNKSLGRTGNVGSATAIDPSRNLAKNVDTLIARVQGAKDVPGRIRMLAKLRALKASLASGQGLPEGVHLVVTSVGGQTTDVSARLKGLGVEHRGDTSPGTATKPPLPKTQPSEPTATAASKAPVALEAEAPSAKPSVSPVPKIPPSTSVEEHPIPASAPAPAPVSPPGAAPLKPSDGPSVTTKPGAAPTGASATSAQPEAVPPAASTPTTASPKALPAARPITIRGRIGGALRTIGPSVAFSVADLLVSLLGSYLKSRLDQKEIERGIAERRPQIERDLQMHAAEIASLQAQGKPVYANVTVFIVRSRSFLPIEGMEVRESAAGVDHVTVAVGAENLSRGEEHLAKKWEFADIFNNWTTIIVSFPVSFESESAEAR